MIPKLARLFLCGGTILFQSLFVANQCRAAGASLEPITINIPKGAYAIERYNLTKERAVQIDFKINKQYPNTDVKVFLARSLNENGWVLCDGEHQWSEFSEYLNSRSIMVRHNLTNFSSVTQYQFLTIVLRYYGEKVSKHKMDVNWNNKEQHVSIIRYELENKAVFEKTLSLLPIQCRMDRE